MALQAVDIGGGTKRLLKAAGSASVNNECCCVEPSPSVSPSGAGGAALGISTVTGLPLHYLVLDERLSSRDGSFSGEVVESRVRPMMADSIQERAVVGSWDRRRTIVEGPFTSADCDRRSQPGANDAEI